jgi:hypothetical protein
MTGEMSGEISFVKKMAIYVERDLEGRRFVKRKDL